MIFSGRELHRTETKTLFRGAQVTLKTGDETGQVIEMKSVQVIDAIAKKQEA